MTRTPKSKKIPFSKWLTLPIATFPCSRFLYFYVINARRYNTCKRRPGVRLLRKYISGYNSIYCEAEATNLLRSNKLHTKLAGLAGHLLLIRTAFLLQILQERAEKK